MTSTHQVLKSKANHADDADLHLAIMAQGFGGVTRLSSSLSDSTARKPTSRPEMCKEYGAANDFMELSGDLDSIQDSYCGQFDMDGAFALAIRLVESRMGRLYFDYEALAGILTDYTMGSKVFRK